MNLPFKSARFITSALLPNEWPSLKTPQGNPMPEIALIGRSNVGKSSLINALLKQKNLAKTSSTPGKTQRMQFFLIDDALLLADLPGYGYAKAPPEAIATWSEAIDTYLHTRSTLKLLLLLLDSRRSPSPEDQQVLQWAQESSIPFLIILTKTDKLSPAELKALAQPPESLLFNLYDAKLHRKLLLTIQKRISL